MNKNFGESQRAIQAYIKFSEARFGDHNDFINDIIVVNNSGEVLFHDKAKVHATIETNYSQVTIIHDAFGIDKPENKFYAQSTNEYQEISFTDNILVISTQNTSGESIKVNIK